MFNRSVAKTYKEYKEAEVKKGRKEVENKLAEREAKIARLRKYIANKQKVVINIEKMGPSTVQPTMGTNQKVKTVVIVDQKPKGVQMRT